MVQINKSRAQNHRNAAASMQFQGMQQLSGDFVQDMPSVKRTEMRLFTDAEFLEFGNDPVILFNPKTLSENFDAFLFLTGKQIYLAQSQIIIAIMGIEQNCLPAQFDPFPDLS
jgi:hypothetical protein